MFQDNQQDWDLYLPYLTMAYRATPHSSTKFTPNFLMFGREVNLPVDVFIGCPPENRIEAHEWVDILQARLEDVYLRAQENLGQSQKRQKKIYDQRSKKATYDVGSKVWVFFPMKKVGVCPKLQCF